MQLLRFQHPSKLVRENICTVSAENKWPRFLKPIFPSIQRESPEASAGAAGRCSHTQPMPAARRPEPRCQPGREQRPPAAPRNESQRPARRGSGTRAPRFPPRARAGGQRAQEPQEAEDSRGAPSPEPAGGPVRAPHPGPGKGGPGEETARSALPAPGAL